MRRDGFTNGATYEEIYAWADEVHKPYIYSISDHFTLVLPDLTYENGARDSDIPVLTFVPIPNGTELDAKVLEFCYKQARKVADIAEYLGVSDWTYLRKQVSENLVNNQYLEKSKISRATYFKTNSDMVSVE